MPTALIVEDEPAANELLAMLVKLRGYTTESAFTGVEALERVRTRRPDIVFLDLMLPDINGYEVCKALKDRKATSLIPVIMVTARVAADNRAESFGVGADDYIPKPYVPDQIFQALADASSWNDRVAGRSVGGVIAIDPNAEQEGRRRLGQLRNLLVARTTLELEAINRISRTLQEIWSDGLCWALRCHHPLDATFEFQVEPDRLRISLHDTSGWLAENHFAFAPEDQWGRVFASASFDEVVVEEPGRRLILHKNYPPVDPAPTA